MKFSFHTNSLNLKLQRLRQRLLQSLLQRLCNLNICKGKDYHSLSWSTRREVSRESSWSSKVISYQMGFSLLEILFVVSLLAFLMSLGYRSMQGFLMREERRLFLASLQDALAYARSEAFFRNSTITLCGSYSQQKCHMQKDWSSGFIIFENPNRDSEPDPQRILRVVPGIRYGKLQFNGVSPCLNISAAGLTMSIGTFLYCPHPPYNKPEETHGLVLNRVFRSYLLRENASGSIDP